MGYVGRSPDAGDRRADDARGTAGGESGGRRDGVSNRRKAACSVLWRANRAGYTRSGDTRSVTFPESEPTDRHVPLASHAYRITLDDGRETFDALEVFDDRSPEAYLMSDTVCSLERMR